MSNNDNKKIKFNIKPNSSKEFHSIDIYRVYGEDHTDNMVYIDTVHPMTIIELNQLKNYLQEYIHNNDWY